MPDRPLSPCPVCGAPTSTAEAATTEDEAARLAVHLTAEAEASDVQHVMWLNRNVTKHRVDTSALAALLRAWQAGGPPGPGDATAGPGGATVERIRR